MVHISYLKSAGCVSLGRGMWRITVILQSWSQFYSDDSSMCVCVFAFLVKITKKNSDIWIDRQKEEYDS